MKKFDKNVQKKILKIILIVIWMIIVFIFSGQKGTDSGNTSRKFTIEIIHILTGKNIALDDPFIEGIQLFIRKLAHFSVYCIGGFLIMSYAYTTEKTQKEKILYSIAFGGGYAITDELHQFFVPGRSARVLDVIIDTAGVIAGVLMYIVMMKAIELLINKYKIKKV